MQLAIDPDTEAKLRARAGAEGLTVEAYVQRLITADEAAEEELRTLVLEGLNSGEPKEVGPGYWEEQHRRLDERLKQTAAR